MILVLILLAAASLTVWLTQGLQPENGLSRDTTISNVQPRSDGPTDVETGNDRMFPADQHANAPGDRWALVAPPAEGAAVVQSPSVEDRQQPATAESLPLLVESPDSADATKPYGQRPVSLTGIEPAGGVYR